MVTEIPLSEEPHDPCPPWTLQDEAEYDRLAEEMNDDAKLQFTLFTFGITASTAVLGLLAISLEGQNTTFFSVFPKGIVFLLPLIVLFPTSLMILNRARTRNRKTSYIIVNFDYKRLCSEGMANKSLDEIRRYQFIPWETALHILDRTYSKKSTSLVHLPPAIKYMAGCYLVIESFCIALAFIASLEANPIALWAMSLLLLILVVIVYSIRIKALRDLRGEISIQGYVERWLVRKYGDDLDGAPRHLKEWLEEFHSKAPANLV